MKAAVIGGAGFIGSHLVDALVERGDEVLVIDDFSVGRQAFLQRASQSGRVRSVPFRVSEHPDDVHRLVELLLPVETVFHMAANPEARWGLDDTSLDLRQNTMTTWAVLEALRRGPRERQPQGARPIQFVLASSGTVYGDVPTPLAEDHGPILPISLYGASKVASEALVAAFSHCFGIHGLIFRFGNVIGSRGTHGVVVDLLKKLDKNPGELEVLGNGRQAKPYLHVSDCVAGMLFGHAHAPGPLGYYNLAPEGSTSVRQIVDELLRTLALDPPPNVKYTGGDRGWPGDVPTSLLDPGKLAHLGFRVRHRSDEAVRVGVAELVAEHRKAATGSAT